MPNKPKKPKITTKPLLRKMETLLTKAEESLYNAFNQDKLQALSEHLFVDGFTPSDISQAEGKITRLRQKLAEAGFYIEEVDSLLRAHAETIREELREQHKYERGLDRWKFQR